MRTKAGKAKHGQDDPLDRTGGQVVNSMACGGDAILLDFAVTTSFAT
jgi:hypothetical protein